MGSELVSDMTFELLAITGGSWRDAPLPQRGDVIDARGRLRLALYQQGMRLCFSIAGMHARQIETNEPVGADFEFGDFVGMHRALIAGELEVRA